MIASMIAGVLVSFPLFSQAPDAGEIMRRVSENQERARSARTAYVYDMNVFVRLKRGSKTAREESREYIVAPTAKGAQRKLSGVHGRIFGGGKTFEYREAGYRTKEADIDGAITNSFARTVLWKNGGFGPAMEWFPIAPDALPKYTFRMLGEELYAGYPVYRIHYQQTDDDKCWTGEVLVHRTEFQPVLVNSEWACHVPTAARVMLGINVHHVGAKITYERFGDDLWFPVRAGGEMKLRLFFLYARTIGFSAGNTGFRKTDVQTSIGFETEANAK